MTSLGTAEKLVLGVVPFGKRSQGTQKNVKQGGIKLWAKKKKIVSGREKKKKVTKMETGNQRKGNKTPRPREDHLNK